MEAPALKRLPILAACALIGGAVAANASPYVVTMDEVGANVVATGSGAAPCRRLSRLPCPVVAADAPGVRTQRGQWWLPGHI